MGGPLLPAYPVRAACEELKTPNLQAIDLLEALSRGAAVFNNATQDLQCFTLPEDPEDDGIWDYQWCTELLPQESYFTLDGKRDMFWSQPYNATFIHERCQREFGILPRDNWIRDRYGDMPRALAHTSNIVLSNGLLGKWAQIGLSRRSRFAWMEDTFALTCPDFSSSTFFLFLRVRNARLTTRPHLFTRADPWSSGGIKKNISDTVQAIILEHGAHHLDLFFSDPRDPPDVTFAREFHMRNIEKWLSQA